jgi:hypothetical protein
MENTENTAGTPFPPEPSPTLTPEPPGKSAIARILGVFFEPDATFTDIARSPGFIAPLLLMILCTFGTSWVIVHRVDMRDFITKQFEKNPRMESMPKDQKEQAIERGAKFSAGIIYATPIFIPLGVLIIAGILMVTGNFIFGGTATYKQIFSVVSHAQLTGIITGILAVVILYLKDPTDVDLQNLVASNLGPLVPAESKFLHRAAISMDLFSFWQIYLMGTGLAICARLSKGKGIMAVAIPWLLFVLIASGFASLQ